jgi:cytochrome P450 / NADPH-cytochrome P450 reductase
VVVQIFPPTAFSLPPKKHPFVDAMVRLLIQAGVRGKQLPVQTNLMFRQTRQFNRDVEFIHGLCDEIIKSRLANPEESDDLLNLMLNGTDGQTGDRLSAENIRYQMVTFLIAGMNRTSFQFLSSMLSWYISILSY